jgi:hypothetical protein
MEAKAPLSRTMSKEVRAALHQPKVAGTTAGGYHISREFISRLHLPDPAALNIYNVELSLPPLPLR